MAWDRTTNAEEQAWQLNLRGPSSSSSGSISTIRIPTAWSRDTGKVASFGFLDPTQSDVTRPMRGTHSTLLFRISGTTAKTMCPILSLKRIKAENKQLKYDAQLYPNRRTEKKIQTSKTHIAGQTSQLLSAAPTGQNFVLLLVGSALSTLKNARLFDGIELCLPLPAIPWAWIHSTSEKMHKNRNTKTFQTKPQRS